LYFETHSELSVGIARFRASELDMTNGFNMEFGGASPARQEAATMANELKPWKYDIQYGPDGEENYAWVYDNHGAMVATMKTHKAKEIVDRMNTRPATPVEGLDSYEYGFPSMTKVERGGDWCDRSQAEAIIAVERAQSVRWAASCGELFSEVETLKADNAALTARVKELAEALETEKNLADRLASALEYIDDYSLSYPDLGTITAVAQPALEAHTEARAALEGQP